MVGIREPLLLSEMLSMLKPLSKAEIIQQMRIAYEYFIVENKDVEFSFPVLILVGEKDSTGKVKAYCKEWAKQAGYPLHFINRQSIFPMEIIQSK